MAETRGSNRKVLVLAGDGIGPEIMRQALRVIEFFDRRHIASFELTEGLVGGAAYDAAGVPLTDDTMGAALASDAGDGYDAAPAATSADAAPGRRAKNPTSCPWRRARKAMGMPMAPAPMKPTFIFYWRGAPPPTRNTLAR